jgi:hypothetical protein
MAHIHIPHEIPVRYLERSRGGMLLGAGMFLVGLVAFVVMLATDARTAWVSYVSNWLFFTSVAMGAVIFAAATTIVSARWNWSLRRVSIGFAAYLPIAFVLMLPMLGLRENYFPWIAEMASDPILQAKQAWLNIPFLVTRNLVGALVLFGAALYFAYLAVRPDLGLAAGASHDDAGRARWRERFTTGWLGQEIEEVRSWRRMSTMAPGLVMVYAVVMSVFAYDWAMSLEPHWFSTLSGGWFFMGAFWGGIAATAVAGVWISKQHPDFGRSIGIQQRHDIGKLAFGFTVFWAYLFWSQYIVIWYGKLPWEQAWIIRRSSEPWAALSVLVIVLCFIVPFIGLIGRAPKLRPGVLATFTGLILGGLWLERYMILAPSVHHEGDPVFGIWHPLIALLFAGPMLLAIRWFWSTFPVLQVWQPLAPPESLEAERHELGVPVGRTAERMGPGTWGGEDVGDAEHRR